MDIQKKDDSYQQISEKDILIKLEKTQQISLLLGSLSMVLLLVVCGFIFYLLQDSTDIKTQLQKRDKTPISAPVSAPVDEGGGAVVVVVEEPGQESTF